MDKECTAQAHVWGHDDPPLAEPGTLESKTDMYLSSFPPSHWRFEVVKNKPYHDVVQDTKRSGMMVLEPGLAPKFNLTMDMDDPKANIGATHVALQNHFMLAIGSSGKELTKPTEKETNLDVKDRDHASQYDIIFRTVMLRTFTMGLTKQGDLTRKKNETGLRHAWIKALGWV